MAYTIVQTVQALNFASNAVAGILGDREKLESLMAVYLNGGTLPDKTDFPGFFPIMNPVLAGGDWQPVWGPAVFCALGPQEKATNVMFVAHSASLKTYVVALAGTNFNSVADWIAEDGNVGADHMALYPIAIPYTDPNNSIPLDSSKPYVSGATADGVSNLMTKLHDPKTDKDIKKYLASVANASETLIFTGHSLGGALSPTLAMQLYPRAQTSASGWQNVLVQPSAGASPGNAAFAQAFAYKSADGKEWAYPATPTGLTAPFDNWNVDYASKRDVVPHAWNRLAQVFIPTGLPPVTQVLGTFQTIYGYMKNTLKTALETKLDTALIGADSLASNGGYMNLPLNEFEPEWGTYDDTGAWVSLPVYAENNPMSTFDEFDPLLLAAHTTQYARFFGVQIPHLPKS